jgi:hypothetical protein
MIVASPFFANSTWVQQEVISQQFAIIAPQYRQMFDFQNLPSLAAVMPNDFSDGQPTMTKFLEETMGLDKQKKEKTEVYLRVHI